MCLVQYHVEEHPFKPAYFTSSHLYHQQPGRILLLKNNGIKIVKF